MKYQNLFSVKNKKNISGQEANGNNLECFLSSIQ